MGILITQFLFQPLEMGSSYRYWRDTNVWEEDTNLSYSWYPLYYQEILYASFALDCLTFLALISFLVWACTIQPLNKPLKGVIAALTMWIWYVPGTRYFLLLLPLIQS